MSIFVFFSLHCVEALQTEKKRLAFNCVFFKTQGLKEVVSPVGVCLHVVSASLSPLVWYFYDFF